MDDWLKGNHAVSNVNADTPPKSTRKHANSKSKLDCGASNGQSTILSFVGGKESKSVVLNPASEVIPSCQVNAPSPPPDDINRTSYQPQICAKQHQRNEVELKRMPSTPSVERVSVKEFVSTGSEGNDICDSTSFPSAQDSSELAKQVEPTRRSARLKSIQVKQALKDDLMSDEEDVQTQKVRSNVAPISKGRLFFLNKEEKEKLRLLEEKKAREEEEEKQRERERQQCERLREEIKRAKEENLQRSLGRQFNPFLLPRAVVTSQAILIDDDENETKPGTIIWQDDCEGSLSPFPLISHVTQRRGDVDPPSASFQSEDAIHQIFVSISTLSSRSTGLKALLRNEFEYRPLKRALPSCSMPSFLTSFSVSAVPCKSVSDSGSRANESFAADKLGCSQPRPGLASAALEQDTDKEQDLNRVSSCSPVEIIEAGPDSGQNILQTLADYTEKRPEDIDAIYNRIRVRRGIEDGRKQWIDTYRPRSGYEVCGNQENVKLLRKWMAESDKDASQKRQRHSSSRRRQESEDDDDESTDQSCQAILISGPSGCGKSAAVYAVAEELKLQVLEINSSDKRCGRLVLDKVGEATRSQSLHKRTSSDQAAVPLHEGSTSEKRKAGRLKPRLDGAIGIDSSDVGGNMALILFEEIDVLLDHDKGFLAAVVALVQQTCVPIVMTCKQKPPIMESLGLRELEWRTPDMRDAMLHLQLIAAVEGVSCSFDEMRSTYTFCQCDFRRTLMLLQICSVNQDQKVESDMASVETTGHKSNSLPHALRVANGLSRLGTLEPVMEIVSEDGNLQRIECKSGMAQTGRILEDANCVLDALLNTTWQSVELDTETDKVGRSKGELDRLLEISQLTDALSHASMLSEVHQDLNKYCSGSCLSSTVACIAAGCLHLVEQRSQVDWFVSTDQSKRWPIIDCQKSNCADLAYPRACGIGRVSSIMLEYAPWVREMCRCEEEKRVLGAFRRRRAAHHLSNLSSLVLESFSSQLILNT